MLGTDAFAAIQKIFDELALLRRCGQAMCATLSVTRSGYHAWSGRRPGPRAQANAGVVAAHRTSASGKPSDLRGKATYDLVVALAEFTDHRLPPRREFFFGTQPRLLMQPDHHALVGHDGHPFRRTQFFRAFSQ